MNSDSRAFRPFLMDLVRNYGNYSDLTVDITTKKNDDYDKRGLIIQVQKVIF
jgi:hypothetical protein